MKHARPDYEGRFVDLAALTPELYPGATPIAEDEPVFILRGKDRLFRPMLFAYRAAALSLPGAAEYDTTYTQTTVQAEYALDWQEDNGTKIPDAPSDFDFVKTPGPSESDFAATYREEIERTYFAKWYVENRTGFDVDRVLEMIDSERYEGDFVRHDWEVWKSARGLRFEAVGEIVGIPIVVDHQATTEQVALLDGDGNPTGYTVEGRYDPYSDGWRSLPAFPGFARLDRAVGRDGYPSAEELGIFLENAGASIRERQRSPSWVRDFEGKRA